VSYGTTTIGRLVLRETFPVTEGNSSNGRTMALAGQESAPPLTNAGVTARHDDIMALPDSPMNVVFTDKPDRNGFYVVTDSSADYTSTISAILTSDWKINLNRLGSESEIDMESRLTGTVRLNDFSLIGERWHAPAIGHYSYYTGASIPTPATRTSVDGALTVYRGLASGTSPRWGVPPTSYPGGRVRVLDNAVERAGVDTPVSAGAWEINNALVRVRPLTSNGSLEVAAWDGAQWDTKNWNVTVAASGAPITAWSAATILRNDFEQCVLRLIAPLSPGRVTLDLTLRRGSRFVECYLQRGDLQTLAAYLNVLENATNVVSGGYVVATNNDAGGNKATAGTARTFTPHGSLGIQKSATAMDFYLGAVMNGTGANAVDTATVLRDQYIGALSEFTVGVRR
jgi:hypothetical protein